MCPLSTRLDLHILKDLAANAPKTLGALDSWLEHCAFWLHELHKHQVEPGQVSFLVQLLGLALAREAGRERAETCQTINEHILFAQIKEVIS